jgi:hypothetical protein
MKALIIFSLLFLFGCSQMKLIVDGKEKHDIKIISHGAYREILGASELLRKVTATTLVIKFRQTGNQKGPQDLIAFSVGGKEKKTSISRASIRMDREGYLTGIARATDTEVAHTIRAKDKIATGEFHTAAMVVDYAKNEMHLYLDGKPLETVGAVAFQAPVTDDTPSISASVGAEDDGSDFFFEGELQKPMLWRRRLEPEEILAITMP